MSIPAVIDYIPRSRWTDRTPAAIPVLLRALRVGAVLTIDWATLHFMEWAPGLVVAAVAIVSLLILGVLESRDWLNFKGKYYFRGSLCGLLLLYIAICSSSFFLHGATSSHADTAVTQSNADELASLRTQIAANDNGLRNARSQIAVLDTELRSTKQVSDARLLELQRLQHFPLIGVEAEIDVIKGFPLADREGLAEAFHGVAKFIDDGEKLWTNINLIYNQVATIHYAGRLMHERPVRLNVVYKTGTPA